MWPGHHYKPPAGCCLFPRGCKFLLWGMPKAKRPPARDQSLPGQHGHSQPPPLPQSLWVLHPACFCRKRGTGASSPAPQSPSAPILLGALSTSRVCVGPTAHGDSSVPPTLAARAVEFTELHFCCSWAPGKGTKEPFSSLASLGVEGEGKRKDQCLQNTTIGRKFSSGFLRLVFFSLSSSF